MRRLALATVFLLVCPIALAHQHAMGAPGGISPCEKKFAPAANQPEFQKVDWRAITGTPEAKLYFSQGMTQYYGFNYEEALRNFRGAVTADKSMAMGHWGIALAAGPNINLGMDKPCHELANLESAKALAMANEQPKLSAVERALIEALPLRYEYPLQNPTAAEGMDALTKYSGALGKKWEDLQFRKDTNYGALYAESLIELHPWALYDNHYAPTSPDTDKIIKVLDAAKAADLNGVGWNHYWIHVAEAGPTPKAAEPSANLLQTLVQASGHLVHMPSHIYLLIGDYNKSLVSNVNAAGADVTEYKKPCSGSYKDYSLNPYCPQLYYGHYLSHNYFFGSVSATFSGQSAKALALACDTREHVEHFVTNEPSLQRYMTAPLMTLVVNRNWKTIINKKQQPEPPSSCYIQPPFTEETGCHILLSIWYWARGMAYASLGDPKQAVTEYNGMNAEMGQVAHHPPTSWGNNDALSVLGIGKAMLFARYEWADGSQQQAIKALVAARDAEDELTYDEPPQWFAPVREALGGAYLQLETPQGFKDAERTFDEELKRRPTSGRALYGKMRALQLQGQSAKAAVAEDDFCRVWKNIADYTMTDADLWPAKNVEGDSYSATTCGKPKKAPSLNNCPVPPSSPASP